MFFLNISQVKMIFTKFFSSVLFSSYNIRICVKFCMHVSTANTAYFGIGRVFASNLHTKNRKTDHYEHENRLVNACFFFCFVFLFVCLFLINHTCLTANDTI